MGRHGAWAKQKCSSESELVGQAVEVAAENGGTAVAVRPQPNEEKEKIIFNLSSGHEPGFVQMPTNTDSVVAKPA